MHLVTGIGSSVRANSKELKDMPHREIPPLVAAGRVAFWGVLAMAASAGVGSLFGTGI
jgi:hypothetical protein